MPQKIKIKNNEIKKILLNKEELFDFPKYTTQLLNLANQNSGGTRPKVVGQMTELINNFSGGNIFKWEEWYKNKYPEAINEATDKVMSMVDNLKDAIKKIDRNLVRKWVKDLVIVKTYMGLCFQKAILQKIAEIMGEDYTLSNPSQEAKGIDGFIGKRAISIKPITYKHKKNLSEKIDCDIIFYDKKKDGITIEFDF